MRAPQPLLELQRVFDRPDAAHRGSQLHGALRVTPISDERTEWHATLVGFDIDIEGLHFELLE